MTYGMASNWCTLVAPHLRHPLTRHPSLLQPTRARPSISAYTLRHRHRRPPRPVRHPFLGSLSGNATIGGATNFRAGSMTTTPSFTACGAALGFLKMPLTLDVGTPDLAAENGCIRHGRERGATETGCKGLLHNVDPTIVRISPPPHQHCWVSMRTSWDTAVTSWV